MDIFTIRVGVATHRPPADHAGVFVQIDADSAIDAELTAIAMVCATRDIVMPVSTEIIDVRI